MNSNWQFVLTTSCTFVKRQKLRGFPCTLVKSDGPRSAAEAGFNPAS
jgi:hypothetical protein